MFKKLCGVLLLTYSIWASSSECPQHYYEQTPPVAPTQTIELCMDGFVVQYDKGRKTPLWSAEYLTQENVIRSRLIERKDDFHAEKRLPKELRATNSDYLKSNFDKGHLTPYRDASFSADIDSLANVAPQDPSLNRGKWAQLEDQVRDDVLAFGNAYVNTGIIAYGPIMTIGKGLPIPTYYYKVVIFSAEKKITIYAAENHPTSEILIWSISDLERISGINFRLQ